ncbi:MAG: hypothetical protein LBB14_03270, partial [Puniceicoccales bacterium]|nr:hypothetical protein [Puniceicoccales bacterium]
PYDQGQNLGRASRIGYAYFVVNIISQRKSYANNCVECHTKLVRDVQIPKMCAPALGFFYGSGEQASTYQFFSSGREAIINFKTALPLTAATFPDGKDNGKWTKGEMHTHYR